MWSPQRRHKAAFLLLAVFLGVSIFGHFSRGGQPALAYVNRLTNATTAFSDDARKTVLLWNSICLLCGTLQFQVESRTPNCTSRCRFTWDKARLHDADAVLVNSRLMHGAPYPKRHHREQIFVEYARESPRRPLMKALRAAPRHFFNATVSFAADADIVLPYGRVIRRPQPMDADAHAEFVRQLIARKRKGVYQVVSRCRTDGHRENLTSELQKHLHIDVYGKCSGRPCDTFCYFENMDTYRFYLGFENSVCDDYVTEKFYRLAGKLVPIVIRARDYRHLPPGSYIAVDEFESLTAFGAHIEHLMHDDAAYARHFDYLRDFDVERMSEEVLCKVCDYVSSAPPQKEYPDVAEWFSPQRRCDPDYVPRLLEEIT